MSRKAKKRIKGGQPPQSGWKRFGTRKIKLSTCTDCPLIKIPVGGQKRYMIWMVDSGAAKTVMDQVSFTENFPEATLENIPEDLSFTTADGSPLQMTGLFETEFWVGKKRKVDKVYVCKGVTKTRLLGSSLLSSFNSWGIDNGKGVFRADDEEIPLIQTAGEPPRTCYVKLKNTVQIPAKRFCFVQAELPNRYKPSEFVFHPDYRVFQRKRLALPVSLVSSDILNGTVLLKVTNPNSEGKILGKGTKLGKVVTNIDEFIITQGLSREGASGVNAVQVESLQSLIDQLKVRNPDLYKLYVESGKNLGREEKDQLLRLLSKYLHVFSVDDEDLGVTTLIKHKIVPKTQEVVYRRQYRHSEEQHKKIDEEVQRLLKSGVIRESMSPFNNPVLMVPKKEPGKWRFCLDCRYINDLTEDQYFPIPLIDEAMDSLAGAKVFTTLDMTSGYHQVPLDEDTSAMCAFSTRKGHFQYKRLPMGLRNSGMTFQKMVTLLMSGMLYSEVLAYLDDCILYSQSVPQHFKTLDEVLQRFSSAGLKLKPRKCHMFQNKIIYLGYLVDSEGIRPNPEAARRIRELAEPTSVVEVQRFLGKINYYRKFIPKLAAIAHPLYALTEGKSKINFHWEVEHQVAFDQLKSMVSSGQVMGHPQFDKEFVVDVDASDYALGAELSQIEENGEERPIYYASRHLEKAERSYSATARETLAAVFGCEHFSHYLHGKKFVLRTDHNPLVWLRSMKNPKRPYSGWIVRLEQFNYIIQYREGKRHINADFNSRIKPTEQETGRRSLGVQTEWQNNSQGRVPGVKSVSYHVHSDAHIKHNLDTSKSSDQVHSDAHVDHEKETSETLGMVHIDAQSPQSGCGMVGEGSKTDECSSITNDTKGCRVVTMADSEDVDEPSIGMLVELQSKDGDIGPVLKKLQDPKSEGELTSSGERLWKVRHNLSIKDGLLVKHHRLRSGLQPIEQIILPKCLKQMVLESLHDSDFAGHFGVKRTVARVKIRYYWPGYLNDIEEWCRTCEVCQKRKNPPSKNIAPLMNIDTGQGPFENVALDILKLPRTSRGNEFLLVIEDYFSKWVEAFPLTRTVAPSVAQCLLNGWIARFGCPYTILSDQGPEFTSHLFKCLSEMLGIRKVRTTTYHPRTDGMVERSNRTLIDILSKYAEGEPDWDLRIPIALFALRTSEHATTGFSPFQLVYGQEARLPWDIPYGPAPTEPLPHVEWVAARKREMTKVFQMVRKHTQRAQLHQKEYFDKNRKGRFQVFERDDKVMYCNPASRSKDGKLNKPWSGPHIVLERMSDALYKVQLNTGEELVVNSERLKKYHVRVTEDQQDDSANQSDSEEDDYDEPDRLVIPDVQEEIQPIHPQELVEARTPTEREPLMREGGKFWSNVDPSNIIEGGRRRI